MTKGDLFEKYSINETHDKWDSGVDNWMSVEVYRIMHDGNLPPGDDMSIGWVTDFLDEVHDSPAKHFNRKDFGSLYLTSKRMVFRLSEQILKEHGER